MRHWWVNQRDGRQNAVGDGCLWCSQFSRGQPGVRYWHTEYDFIRLVQPGDIVFYCTEDRLRAVGQAVSSAYEAPRPESAGGTVVESWGERGWRVEVDFTPLPSDVGLSELYEELSSHAPEEYLPFDQEGKSKPQYLFAVPRTAAAALEREIESRGVRVPSGADVRTRAAPPDLLGDHLQRELTDDLSMGEIERETLIQARRGRGTFRERVCEIEKRCRVTGVENPEYLVATHIWPWRYSTNPERLDGNNGLLLAPHVAFLFDRGYISFEDAGTLLLSPAADQADARRLGLEAGSAAGEFADAQLEYLRRHREGMPVEGYPPVFRGR